jgi:3-deoxy-D-manno-octulosonic acid hydroxylase-like protein
MELIAVEKIQPSPERYAALEEGNLLLIRNGPWAKLENDWRFLRAIPQTSGAHHKNIAYRPASGKVTGFDAKAVSEPRRLHSALKAFSNAAIDLLEALLPLYMRDCRIDYASFRPVEEQGRHLPFNKRNDLLHIDAFPTRPTGGDLILRTFVNIHPSRPRGWVTSDPFGPLAQEHPAAAGWPHAASRGGLMQLFTHRTAYDRFMMRFHDYLKRNRKYQQTCPKYRWEFPPGATWIAFTDIVPQAVLSGQYALEQTVIVSRHALQSPASAPIEILNRLASPRAAGAS